MTPDEDLCVYDHGGGRLCGKRRVTHGAGFAHLFVPASKSSRRVLRAYTPGKDATVRPWEIRAEINSVCGDLHIQAAYTDEEGGYLSWGICVDRQTRCELLRYLTENAPRPERDLTMSTTTWLIDMDDYTMGGGDYVLNGRHVRLLGRGASNLCFVYMDEPEPREQVWQGVSQFGEMVRDGRAVKRVEPEAERVAREEVQRKRAEL